MVANKEATDTQKDLVGHVPGVLVGTRFENRGELSILGLHSTILSGIHKAAGYVPCRVLVGHAELLPPHDSWEHETGQVKVLRPELAGDSGSSQLSADS